MKLRSHGVARLRLTVRGDCHAVTQQVTERPVDVARDVWRLGEGSLQQLADLRHRAPAFDQLEDEPRVWLEMRLVTVWSVPRQKKVVLERTPVVRSEKVP